MHRKKLWILIIGFGVLAIIIMILSLIYQSSQILSENPDNIIAIYITANENTIKYSVESEDEILDFLITLLNGSVRKVAHPNRNQIHHFDYDAFVYISYSDGSSDELKIKPFAVYRELETKGWNDNPGFIQLDNQELYNWIINHNRNPLGD